MLSEFSEKLTVFFESDFSILVAFGVFYMLILICAPIALIKNNDYVGYFMHLWSIKELNTLGRVILIVVSASLLWLGVIVGLLYWFAEYGLHYFGRFIVKGYFKLFRVRKTVISVGGKHVSKRRSKNHLRSGDSKRENTNHSEALLLA